MKTVIRNSYTPKLGDYCETIVVDKESEDAYIFDCDGVFTAMPQPVDVEEILARAAEYTDETVAPINEKLETIEEGAQVNKIEHVLRNGTELTITNKTVNVTVPTKTSDLTNDGSDGTDTYVESATLGDYYTKTETDTQIGYETTAREIADAGLQEQIDAIVASSDVVDIVGTYAALQAYDTSKLHDNDIIKVLTDETRDDAITYYRWDADTSTWSYIGAEGPFYTKAESDATFVPQTRTINSKALSSDITLTAQDVGALPDSTVIPTVNDATLSILQNGTLLDSFTANSATNTSVDIITPTATSDLTNDSGFITAAAIPTDVSAFNNDAGYLTSVSWTDVADRPTNVSDFTNDAGYLTSVSWSDILDKPTIPTVNDGTLTIQKNGVDVATFSANQSAGATANITVPVNTSDLVNDSGFITTAALSNYYTKSETYSQNEVNSLINSITVPTKTSDLTNDGSDGNSTYVEADELGAAAFSNDYNDLDNLPTIPSYSDFTGATSSTAGAHGLVPAPAAGDQDKYLKGDGTWGAVQSGVSTTTYYCPFVNPTALYSDAAMTVAVTGAEVLSAFENGPVIIERSDSLVKSYIVNSDEDGSAIIFTVVDGYNITPQNTISFVVRLYKYPDKTVTAMNTNSSYGLQRKLTAGTNISIDQHTNTISASIPIDSALDISSTNPVENSVVTAALNNVQAHLVEMSYGESNAWAKFIAAYNAGSIVYCRASSNADPSSGSQTRKAFMAYVNNAANPTNVEFQYVRSVGSKTDSQQCDQVFVYKLTNASGGTWSVETRNMATKVNVDSSLTKTFSNGANATMTLSAKTMTGATSGTAGTAGYVPAPAAGDEGKYLKGDGTWATVPGGGATAVTYYTTTSSSAIYSDQSMTTVASYGDIETDIDSGKVMVYISDLGVLSEIVDSSSSTVLGVTTTTFIGAMYDGTIGFVYTDDGNTTTLTIIRRVDQGVLTAGSNISIDSATNTISATDTTYSAGTGIDITNDTISVDNTVAMVADLPSTINSTDWSGLWQ